MDDGTVYGHEYKEPCHNYQRKWYTIYNIHPQNHARANKRLRDEKTQNVDPPEKTTVWNKTDTERKEPTEYVIDKVLHRRHMSEDFEYEIRWYGYKPEADPY